MNHTIQQLISFVGDHDDISTEEAINQFFRNIIWSIEKMEWEGEGKERIEWEEEWNEIIEGKERRG